MTRGMVKSRFAGRVTNHKSGEGWGFGKIGGVIIGIYPETPVSGLGVRVP